jgi:hypothetical protein
MGRDVSECNSVQADSVQNDIREKLIILQGFRWVVSLLDRPAGSKLILSPVGAAIQGRVHFRAPR